MATNILNRHVGLDAEYFEWCLKRPAEVGELMVALRNWQPPFKTWSQSYLGIYLQAIRQATGFKQERNVGTQIYSKSKH